MVALWVTKRNLAWHGQCNSARLKLQNDADAEQAQRSSNVAFFGSALS